MLVMSIGVREAARKMGIPESTVQAWSARGEWLKALRRKPATIVKPASMVSATIATSPVDVLRDTLAENARNTKLGFTKYAARIAGQAGETGTLEEAPLFKAVADIHAKMQPQEQGDCTVGLAFFSISIGSGELEAPTVDVEAEVIRTEEQE